ncbi:hypothetical protein LEP1GSC061_2764 [Leptospira wolffii serovar Khorat str. Khorat-H2]|nr:hypothetical protein LEP1GSC061_2764 [Leptospira wolffii serovar Khorat str. Khorat-H2]
MRICHDKISFFYYPRAKLFDKTKVHNVHRLSEVRISHLRPK